ncbi:MAG: hypothetical protein KF893_22165 [Caldilineaceae bacterium]|nr:hypothetical protein [Caldilineaceae bacterium]
MENHVRSYTTESVLTALGYPDPLAAARQQALMILLGRKAHYQAAIQQIQARWDCTLEELRARYEAQDTEDFEADDDYLQWRWYLDAIEIVEAQLAAIAES